MSDAREPNIRDRIDRVLFAVVAAVRRGLWQQKRWAIKDTVFGSPQGKGVSLICPEGHEYWGRSLSEAERELVEEKRECPACERGLTLITFS